MKYYERNGLVKMAKAVAETWRPELFGIGLHCIILGRPFAFLHHPIHELYNYSLFRVLTTVLYVRELSLV